MAAIDSGRWRQAASRRAGAADFGSREQGEMIWHPPHRVHATRTGPVPLLALYIWTSDVEQPARLVR